MHRIVAISKNETINMDKSIVPFLIVAILATSILIFFMVVIIITYTKRVSKREKEYLKKLMEDRERTYHQLSVELHDNVTNMMTIARMHINDIEENQADIKTINKVGNILDELIKDTHHFSRGLNSDYITKYGIITVITEELEWIENSKKIECVINVLGKRKPIPAFKQQMLYRIVQEALMNSVKYAHATIIDVQITFNKKYFELKISDNGIGFDMNDKDFKQGVGISSMQERAIKLDGKITIETQPSKGTKIIFRSNRFLA